MTQCTARLPDRWDILKHNQCPLDATNGSYCERHQDSRDNHILIVKGGQISVFSCSRKSQYLDLEVALRAGRRMRDVGEGTERLAAFDCTVCGHYHLGRLSELDETRYVIQSERGGSGSG